MKINQEEQKFKADVMQDIAKLLVNKLPEGFQFALLVFPSSNAGIGNYVSNAHRSDMITALKETATRIEKNQDKPRFKN